MVHVQTFTTMIKLEGRKRTFHTQCQLALLKCYVLHPKHDLGIISVHKPNPLDIGCIQIENQNT